MTDMSHPDPTVQEDEVGPPQSDKARSLADMGEASIHLFVLLCCVLLITPLGRVAPIAVLLGLLLFAFAAQLVLRFPSVVLPDVFREPLEKLAVTQRALGWVEQKRPEFGRFQREFPHWLMDRPFDLFPRVLLAICGLVVLIGSAYPAMALVLGAAGILMSISIMARNLGFFFLGAAVMSWSSILPLIAN